jgi:hypothetical protein
VRSSQIYPFDPLFSSSSVVRHCLGEWLRNAHQLLLPRRNVALPRAHLTIISTHLNILPGTTGSRTGRESERGQRSHEIVSDDEDERPSLRIAPGLPHIRVILLFLRSLLSQACDEFKVHWGGSERLCTIISASSRCSHFCVRL